MSKLHFFLMGALTISVCVYIAVLFRTSTPAPEAGTPTGDTHIRIYTDKETGCQYLGFNQSGITPRMHADGTQMCASPRKAGTGLMVL